MIFLVQIDNGQHYDEFDKWIACACKTQDEAFRASQIFTEWIARAQKEYDAYMEVWKEKNPVPEWGSEKDDEIIEAYNTAAEKEIEAIGRTIGPPPIWGRQWDAGCLAEIEEHNVEWFQVPEWEDPLPRCRVCNHGLVHHPPLADPICVMCAYDERARNSPLQKHQTCHYCGLSHYKVEAGGIYHCPNRLCPGCGAATTREKMKLKSFKNVEDGRYTLDPEELIHYVANHPHKDPEVHAKEKECVPKWLTGKKPQ